MDALLPRLAETLLAYLVHSTLLICGVWLLLKFVPIRSNPLREALWTVALFGGFATALLQSGGAIESRTWTLALERLSPGAPETAPADIPAAESVPPVLPALLRERATHPAAGGIDARPGARVPAPPSPGGSSRFGEILRRWPLGWLFGALVAGAFLARALVRQRGWLGDRMPIDDPEWIARLERLKTEIGVAGRVRLSAASGLSSPVAFGVIRPEICVPLRAFCELSPAQQDAMIAHELAHLRRGDPLRLVLARLAEVVAFFQPLNRLARRRLFEVVEQRCDAIAIEAIGSGMALAECLTEVASWWAAERAPEVRAGLPMAGSPLTARVEKLLQDDEAVAVDLRRRWLAPLLYLFLPSLAAIAPAVSVAAEPERGAPMPRRVAERALQPESDDVAAIRLLEVEIDLLTNEVNELRAELVRSGLVGVFADEIEGLERRVMRLKDRRALLTEWRQRLVREAGLAAPSPVAEETAKSPGSR